MSKDTASQSQAVPSELASLPKYYHNEFSKEMHNDPCGEFYKVEDVQSLFSHSAATGKVPETECSAFEAWAKKNMYVLDWNDEGHYESGDTASAWDGWCAGWNTRAALASPAAPLAGKAEPTAIYQAWDALDGGWMDTDKDGYDRVPEDGRRIVYTAPLAAAVPAEEALDLPNSSDLPELAERFATAYEKGQPVTLLPGTCRVLFEAMTTAPAEPAPIQSSALTARVNEFLVDAEGDPCRATQEAAQLIVQAAELVRELEAARLSKPTAQGAAEPASIDTREFHEMLGDFRAAHILSTEDRANAIIAHINRHIAAQATAGRDAVRDNLIAALKDVCDAARPVGTAAYNLGQSHEQWPTIREHINKLDNVRDEAYTFMKHLKSHAAEQASGGAK